MILAAVNRKSCLDLSQIDLRAFIISCKVFWDSPQPGCGVTVSLRFSDSDLSPQIVDFSPQIASKLAAVARAPMFRGSPEAISFFCFFFHREEPCPRCFPADILLSWLDHIQRHGIATMAIEGSWLFWELGFRNLSTSPQSCGVEWSTE